MPQGLTPGPFTTPFYHGAAWSFDFHFTDENDAPLDITGLGPFVLAIRRDGGRTNLVRVESTGTYDATGVVTFSLTEEESAVLPIGNVLVGVSDAEGIPYMIGVVPVNPFPI